MIVLQDILLLHQKSIALYGGSTGVRDIGMIESAIARPFQTFGGAELYPTILEKAAALGESLIANHPFVDGNKRTGLLAMAALLLENNIKIEATEEELYTLIIAVSIGETKFDQILQWLKKNTTAL